MDIFEIIYDALDNLRFDELLETFFTDLVSRIDSFIELLDGFFGHGLISFLKYVWYFCIPGEIVDIILLFFALLLYFAFARHSK